MTTDNAAVGTVVSLWRYPVKSMQGEELNASLITERGLHGDRAFALIDTAEGRVVSAKNPRRWPNLFSFRAAYAEPVDRYQLPGLRITLPDGQVMAGTVGDRDEVLSTAVGRAVWLCATPPADPVLEEYWPDVEGLPHRDAVTDEKMPAGGFFDLAAVHLLTTATLDGLRALYPQGRFEARRFRPNVVVACDPGESPFVEQNWIGRTVALGDTIRLQVTGPCPRCVMTTLAQADLPADPGILRTAVRHAEGNVGVYARVLRGGTVRRGVPVRLE